MNLPASDAARLAELIAGDVYGKKLDLSARGFDAETFWGELPTVTQVRRFRARGESARAVRWFLTFICAVNRMRNATQLWRAGAVLFDSHPEVFDPCEVSSMPFDALRELLRANRVSKKHGPDSDAWRRIAESLASGQGAVARLVHDGVRDAEAVGTCAAGATDRPGIPCSAAPRSDRCGSGSWWTRAGRGSVAWTPFRSRSTCRCAA